MTCFSRKFDLHKEALEENLEAISILLDYDKTQNPDKWGTTSGCLGYSALILICSHINAFGNLFYGQKIGSKKIDSQKGSFHIINSNYFDSQNIPTYAVDKFYGCYRNKLTHNLALPTNFIIKLKSDSGVWFEMIKDSTEHEIISTVYLQDLYLLCIKAYEKLRDEHSMLFYDSTKIADITLIDLAYNTTPINPGASGITTSFET